MLSDHRVKIKGVNVLFKGTTQLDVITTQRAFLEQAIAARLIIEDIEVDNSNLRLDVGVVCFFDFTTGKCGFSHTLPGVVLGIFKEINMRQRPRMWWYTVYKGGALPSPIPWCKKPWR